MFNVVAYMRPRAPKPAVILGHLQPQSPVRFSSGAIIVQSIIPRDGLIPYFVSNCELYWSLFKRRSASHFIAQNMRAPQL